MLHGGYRGGRGGRCTGPNGVVGMGVAGLMGSGRDGREGVRVTGLFPGAGNVGKNSVSAGVSRHVA
jgi:hypothetical protein